MRSEQEKAKPAVVVICGPTGIGKTAAAIAAAQAFGGEIISADSMQVYRLMNIGTAKPTAGEIARARHHMIDIVDPNMHFDAAMYSRQAQEIIRGLHTKGVLPIVAGGTGLYIKTLAHGIFDSAPIPPEIRERLKQAAQKDGIKSLHARLARCDPDAASRINPNDAYRIIRGLEIFEATGQPMSFRQNRHGFQDTLFEVLKIGLEMDRKSLYDRINRRVDQMIGEGMLEEVQGLLASGYAPALKSMQSIGYRHMVEYIHKTKTWDEAVGTMKRDTRRFAKRQITWFAKDDDITWKHPRDVSGIQEMIRVFLNRP